MRPVPSSSHGEDNDDDSVRPLTPRVEALSVRLRVGFALREERPRRSRQLGLRRALEHEARLPVHVEERHREGALLQCRGDDRRPEAAGRVEEDEDRAELRRSEEDQS